MGWAPRARLALRRVVLPLVLVALPLDLEERRSQDETCGEHQDYAENDDTDQRPDLLRGRGLQRLRHHPDEEPGRAERQYAEDQRVPDAADNSAPVIDQAGERSEDVKDGEQQAGHVDDVVEGVLDRSGQ